MNGLGGMVAGLENKDGILEADPATAVASPSSFGRRKHRPRLLR